MDLFLQPNPPRTLAGMVWPTASWVALPTAPHPKTITYESGPTPFIEIRPVGGTQTLLVWIGETIVIPFDGSTAWEARASKDLYGGTDALRSAAAVTATNVLVVPLDKDPSPAAEKGTIVLSQTATVVAADVASTLFLNVPLRGLRLAYIAMVVRSITGGLTITPTFSGRWEGTVEVEPLSPGLVNTQGNIRKIFFGEDNTTFIGSGLKSGLTSTYFAFAGMPDRVSLGFAGAVAGSGTVDILLRGYR